MPTLILASTSVWRSRLLTGAGIHARAEAPGVDEEALVEPDPVRRARALARRKAEAVALRFPDAWVLGADQVAFDEQGSFGKPTDPADHLSRLRSFVGRKHSLVTGVAVIAEGVTRVEHVQTDLWVRGDLEDDELVAYVASGEGSGCAGGYAFEGRGAFLFERVEGDPSNIIGLPLPTVLGMLRALGWRYQ